MVRRETRARRRGEGKKIAVVSMVAFFVFLSISFWFTETENLETIKESEDFRGFVEETSEGEDEREGEEDEWDAVAKKNAERLRGYTLHAEPLL